MELYIYTALAGIILVLLAKIISQSKELKDALAEVNRQEKLVKHHQKLVDDTVDKYHSKQEAQEAEIKELKQKLKEQTPDDATELTIQQLTSDLKTHGFNFIRINPDQVFLR